MIIILTIIIFIAISIINVIDRVSGYNDYTVNLWDALKCERITVTLHLQHHDNV